LVRSTATAWEKGSLLAVDAGVHLGAIIKILEGHKSDYVEGRSGPVTLIDGPFEGLQLKSVTAGANAAYVTQHLVDSFLITHPHLDHVSGFVVNTASLPGSSRPKRVAALPSTIQALKTHIFNNIIWPNLSDENNGAGLFTYMRLVEGGSPAYGDGDGKGYIEICEGLSVKVWSVSHGHCVENHSHRGSSAGPGGSVSSESSPNQGPTLAGNSRGQVSSAPRGSGAGLMSGEMSRSNSYEQFCVYDSSASFIRDIATGKEVLIFGDVEPDSISLSPRNIRVWQDAAPKIASGQLLGIFIECSYDDSRAIDMLFGHLTPRFLYEELRVLAGEVNAVNGIESPGRKRKRASNGNKGNNSMPPPDSPRKPSHLKASESPLVSPLNTAPNRHFDGWTEETLKRLHGGNGEEATPNRRTARAFDRPRRDAANIIGEDDEEGDAPTTLSIRNLNDPPLKGIKVVIIHVKEKLNDGPDIGEIILTQLRSYEARHQLGCEFVKAEAGKGVYL
jgi:cAMP phosphodiesterase